MMHFTPSTHPRLSLSCNPKIPHDSLIYLIRPSRKHQPRLWRDLSTGINRSLKERRKLRRSSYPKPNHEPKPFPIFELVLDFLDSRGHILGISAREPRSHNTLQ